MMKAVIVKLKGSASRLAYDDQSVDSRHNGFRD